MRDLIGRVLRGRGYEVDVAGTVERALVMEPIGYDVLLIDDRLGNDRGTDLIASLADQDPGIPARCVLITGGGPTGSVPAGTAVLTKPFDPAALRQSVEAAAGGGGLAGPGRNAFFGKKDLRGLNPAAQADPGERPGGVRVVELISRLRAHDHDALADLLHDGPAQELGASILALELIRRAVPAELAGRVDEVIGWLSSAAGSLRDLPDPPARRIADQGGLARALPGPVRLAGAGELSPSEQVAVLTIAELLIGAIARPGLASEMTIRNREAFLLIELKIFRDRADDEYLSLLAAAAGMFGGSAEPGPGECEWRVRIELRRLAQRLGEDLDDAFLLGRGDLGVDRQAQQFGRRPLGHREASAGSFFPAPAGERAGAVDRRRVVNARADSGRPQVGQHPVSFRYPDDVQVPDVGVARQDPRPDDAGEFGQGGVVAGGGLAPGLVPGRKAAKLRGQDHGLQGVQAAVHADNLVHVLAGRTVFADHPDQPGQLG
jgi:CheY-like chemotaxis protein